MHFVFIIKEEENRFNPSSSSIFKSNYALRWQFIELNLLAD